jgi:hypothetical protein
MALILRAKRERFEFVEYSLWYLHGLGLLWELEKLTQGGTRTRTSLFAKRDFKSLASAISPLER